MVILVFALLLLVTSAESLLRVKKNDYRCWTSGNGQHAQWWEHGSEITRGKYFYTCYEGTLKPEGCVVNDTFRLKINESYIEGGYEIECVLSKNEHLHFKFVSCISSDGRKHKADETWEDLERSYWFYCKPDGQYLRETVGGCVSHDKTQRIKLGEEYDFGNFTYKCSLKSTGAVSMCSVGCIHNGAHYEVGEQWPDGDVVFYCKRIGGRTQKVFVGCQYEGKSLFDGDRFTKGSVIYECKIRPDSYSHKPVGCVYTDQNGTVVERVIGCRWFQRIGNTKVERTCVLNSEEDATIIQSLGCVFEWNGYDTLFVYPDSYTIWTAPEQKLVVVACKKSLSTSELYLESFGPEELGTKAVGYRYDNPHGT